ncbi:MAG: tRNA lysidine(34) synthetase TilS [Bacteriovoracia bacterium]
MKPTSSLFFQHVLRFLQMHSGEHFPQKMVVGASGGLDSRVLLEWALWLRAEGHIQSLRVLAVHHHTRVEQENEMELVAQVCRDQRVSWQILHITGKATHNREEFWRRERLALMNQALASDEVLLLGHHLNDSWEWAQLQQARSSEVRSGLGIALKSGRIWHPFMCVSKEQIRREAQRRNLSWMEDPSNSTKTYARALFRQEMAGLLVSQHPQFLKHYAHRSQRLAEQLGVALKKAKEAQRVFTNKCHLYLAPPSEAQLLISVRQLSQAMRGTLYKEIPKILAAQSAGKQGPFQLSGGVRVVAYGAWLMVMARDFQTVLPEAGLVKFQSFKKAEFADLIESHLTQQNLLYAPFWCAFETDQKCANILQKTQRDALWKEISQQKIPVINAQRLLSRWKNPHLELRLAPLWPLRPESGQA